MALHAAVFLCALHAAVALDLSNHSDVRADLCNATKGVTEGTLEIQDALVGRKLTFIAEDYDGNSHWYTRDETTGVDSGFHVELMDLLAARAGFTYEIVRITSAEFEGRTWSEYLDHSVRKYDANLDWWLQTSSRSRNGIRSPYAFLDMSIVASEFKQETTFDYEKFWSFAAPFDPLLWGVIVATTGLTAVIYLLIEQKRNQSEIRPGAALSEKLGNVLYLAVAQFTGGGGYAPETGFGKGLLISYSFIILLLGAAYTANLATFLITNSVSGLDSLQDAVDQGERICVYGESAPDEWIRAAHPSAHVVPISGDAWAGLAAGECAVAVGGRLNFEFALQDAAKNPECALAQVGKNSERIFSAGWMCGVDYYEKCTSLIIDVFAFWLLELENEGAITEQLEEMKGDTATKACSDGLGETDALVVADMGGIFILHGIVCVAILAAYGSQLLSQYYWERRGWGTEVANLSRRQSASAVLEASEEADDRPATKTDVAHIYAHIDDRIAELAQKISSAEKNLTAHFVSDRC